jgi:hypothetical protein
MGAARVARGAAQIVECRIVAFGDEAALAPFRRRGGDERAAEQVGERAMPAEVG